MKTKVFSFSVTVLALLIMALPAEAQFGGLKLPGSSKDSDTSEVEAPPSAEQLEADLKAVIVNSSRAVAALNEALGLKEQADIAAKNAECVESGECGVADSIGVLQKSSSALKETVEARKAEGTKLSAESGAAAAQAVGPGIKTIPAWIKVKKGAEALSNDKRALMKAGALAKAAPKVPGAVGGTVSLVKATLSYLSFSGIDTSAMEEEVNVATADL